MTDDFDELMKDVDFSTPPGIVPVSTLNDIALIERYNEVKDELMNRGEALSQRTQTARDLQSERTALLVEMARRGLR